MSVVVAPTTLVEVRGANGSGKSTLLRLLAGATVPTRGARLRAQRGGVGYAPERLAPPPPSQPQGYLREHARLRSLERAEAEGQILALSDRLALRESAARAPRRAFQRLAAEGRAGAGSAWAPRRSWCWMSPSAALTSTRAGPWGALRERVASGAAVIFSDHRAAGSQIAADATWLVAEPSCTPRRPVECRSSQRAAGRARGRPREGRPLRVDGRERELRRGAERASASAVGTCSAWRDQSKATWIEATSK